MGAYCAGLFLLAALAREDIREKRISLYKLLIFALMALFYQFLAGDLSLRGVIGCMIPGSMLLFLSWMTGEGIGYGDGMAVMALGLWTGGWFAFQALVMGFLLAGIYGAVCLVRGKRDVIPFIPFLLAGMEVTLIYA